MGDKNKNMFDFETSNVFMRTYVIDPPIPAKPVPEDQPATKSFGKFFKYPRIMLSPKEEHTPKNIEGTNDNQKALSSSLFNIIHIERKEITLRPPRATILLL